MESGKWREVRYVVLWAVAILTLVALAGYALSSPGQVHVPELKNRDPSFKVFAVQLFEVNGNKRTWAYYQVGDQEFRRDVEVSLTKLMFTDIGMRVLADFPEGRHVKMAVFIDGEPVFIYGPVKRYDSNAFHNVGDLLGVINNAFSFNTISLHTRMPYHSYEVRVVVFDEQGNYGDVTFRLKPVLP